MMKQHLLRFLLIPALLCVLFGAACLSTSGTAHAATVQSHTATTPLISHTPCGEFGEEEVETSTDGQIGDASNICFWGRGGEENPGLYDVDLLYSGNYTVSFRWLGCDGAIHSSKLGPYQAVSDQNFAGCPYMVTITYINLA